MSVNHVPNKVRREESDAKILNAAIKNFGTYGYSKCSISQIAKDAGVSPGLITNRYSSKEELYSSAYEKAFEEVCVNQELIDDAESFLIQAIANIINISKKDICTFNFLSMLYVSYDKPGSIKIKVREEFRATKAYALLEKEQEMGVLQKGDIVNLVDAFLAHVYIQIGICKKYGIDVPSNDYFMSAILSENVECREFYNNQFINFLLKEYQSAWLIKLEDLSIKAYSYDENKAVPNSVQIVKGMNNYEEARLWYIENYVVEQSKKQLLEQTSIPYLLTKISDDKSFFIEYGRKNGAEINYNQLCYNKVVNRNGGIEYIAMGFRNIDISKRTDIDDLTGLYTRQAFFRKAEELLRENPNEVYDLFISDIIDFKKINETYGVKVADDILRWESNYLLSNIRNDALLGRYGGDQVAVFGTHEKIKEIISIENKAKFLASERENGLPEITIKFGVYESVKRDKSIVSTCDKAHMALNTIKYHYEKDIACYTEKIKEHVNKQRQIESSMHKSLNDGDFKVYYQPKHDAATGKLVGAEALVRWIHPQYGFMSPADFIPLFERNGFIKENDRFVWRRTCENQRRWLDKGLNTIPISVNASKLTMEGDDIVENMKASLDEFDVSSDKLHIEITESLMSDNFEDLLNKLNRMRELGFKVELDDFGSGYSSINVLSTLPIDVLKLDMSFMQQFGDEKRQMVLEACIDLAKKLGFETVSEGVELEEQKNELGKLGVDMIQGYYYSKPLPEDEFEKYMMEHSA